MFFTRIPYNTKNVTLQNLTETKRQHRFYQIGKCFISPKPLSGVYGVRSDFAQKG